MNNSTPHPLLDLAFRPLFIAGSLFSIIALMIWAVLLVNAASTEAFLPLQLWHGHEMLYGFVAAILVGFLLTAVQNWTGLRSVHGPTLLILVLLWIAGRLSMWPWLDIAWWLRLIADCSFLLLAAICLGRLLYQKGQRRNYFAVVALLILVINNLIFHHAIYSDSPLAAAQSLYSMVFVITLMMTTIGGRVIPMFTANTTQIPPRRRLHWLDNAGLSLLWSLVLIYFLQIQDAIPPTVLIGLFAFTALFLGIRCGQWRFLSTLPHPLLWSLHLGYWSIPVGLALFALHYAGLVSFSMGLHTLTVAAMAGLILSMISRVSLGHTGRQIVASTEVTIALVMIFVAALFRVVIASVFQEYSLYAWWFSIAIWVGAFSLFLLRYVPILISPRLDAKR